MNLNQYIDWCETYEQMWEIVADLALVGHDRRYWSVTNIEWDQNDIVVEMQDSDRHGVRDWNTCTIEVTTVLRCMRSAQEFKKVQDEREEAIRFKKEQIRLAKEAKEAEQQRQRELAMLAKLQEKYGANSE